MKDIVPTPTAMAIAFSSVWTYHFDEERQLTSVWRWTDYSEDSFLVIAYENEWNYISYCNYTFSIDLTPNWNLFACDKSIAYSYLK